MKSALRISLETQIEEIANSRLSLTKKIEQIFDLGLPQASQKVKALRFKANAITWSVLKLDREFWLEITRTLNVPDYEAIDTNNTATFGVNQILNAIGGDFFTQLTQLPSLLENEQETDFYSLSEAQQRKKVRDAFYNYMTWYDSEASIHFLVLYAYYLRIKNQALPIDITMQHRKASDPLFKNTSIPTTTLVKEEEVKVIESSSSSPPPLEIVVDNEFFFHTQIRIVDKANVYLFFLEMQKRKGGRVFTVSLDKQEEDVATKGVITDVIKFVSFSTIYAVLIGPIDNILLRINFTDPFPLRVDHDFPRLDPTLFDDLVYHDARVITKVATNRKSVDSLDTLRLIDLSIFMDLDKRLGDEKLLTKAEKKRHMQQLLRERDHSYTKDRELTSQEKELLAELRLEEGRGRVANDTTQFNELNLSDSRYIRRRLNLYVKEDILYTRPLVKPLAPVFKSRIDDNGKDTIFVKDDVEVIAARVINVPYTGRPFLFTLVVLARKYVTDSESTLHLYTYRYNSNATQDYVADRSQILDVCEFLLDKSSHRVREFNLIFHVSTYFFHIEVIYESLIGEQVTVRSSDLLYYNFEFRVSLPGALTPNPSLEIKDYKLIDTVRRHNYRIYDFRHHRVLDTDVYVSVAKFDAIFYKYDYKEESARVIFYKAREDKPGIADITVKLLAPNFMIGFTPMRSAGNLTFMQLKSLPTNTTALYRIRGTDTSLKPQDDQFTLATHLNASLTLRERPPFCTFCGGYTDTFDLKSSFYYCDELCQLLFCATNRL